ncbi:MAG: 30S ribosomal protein S2 [Propionibacteriaceae bacterium]|jgi:small subunit ribosomal protein S2|nr:30S ribosomal protein S2 [Propionibacteriaceae bacterium]
MAEVTARQLLESGVHFGHQTRRWNPKMKRYIFNERNGIYIIDLRKSLGYIDQAFAFVKDIVAKGGQVLFVGTKKQAQSTITEQATRVNMPYVNQRWLGGMLTNFPTINKRTQRLRELESTDLETVQPGGLTKKELLGLRREKAKLSASLGGIKDMPKVPAAVWVVDTIKEHLAIEEAKKLGIPVIAILDTNCDPDDVDYPIPGNDDAIRSVSLLTKVIADAVAEGLVARTAGSMEEMEPLAEWEKELLAVAEPVTSETTADVSGATEVPVTESTSVVAEAPVTESTPVVAEAPVTEEAPVSETPTTATATVETVNPDNNVN